MSYILNLDAKFKMGGRKIAKITEQEFHNEIKKFFKKYPDIWPEPDGTSFDTSLDRFVPAVAGLGVGYEGIDCQIRKDFKGVEVDLENQEMLGKIRFTPSGCPYVVGYVGGDWENPEIPGGPIRRMTGKRVKSLSEILTMMMIGFTKIFLE